MVLAGCMANDFRSKRLVALHITRRRSMKENAASLEARLMVKTTMEESRKKAERLVDVNTIQHTVCLDAGIATEENLQKIKEKGSNYLCVSRRRLTDYEIAPDAQMIFMNE